MINQFIPQGHCYLWNTNLVGLHLISDLLIALSYYLIFITIIYFVRQQKDLPYASTFVLFGAFIVSCGTTHLLEIWTLWHPIYWISGIVKAITALISCYTATEMLAVVPEAINLPSLSQFQLANQKLEQEIVERKQIEAKLAKERSFMRAMLDNLSDGIVTCDRHGVLSMFNRATQEFHGLPQQEIAADKWSEHYDLYLPDGKTKMAHEEIPLFRAFKGESIRDVEMAIVPKQGKPRNLIANADPIIDSNGEKLGAIAIMRDITETKQAQQALQMKESAIKSFYDSAPLMMGIVELVDRQDLSHVSGNSMAAAAFSLSLETIAGKRFSELNLPQKIQRRLVVACLQSQARLEPVELEFTYKVGGIDKDFWAIISLISQSSSSKFPLFSYMVQDISGRKRMETRIQESEERFRLAFEDAATGMTLVDLDGRFMKVNRSLCEIVGYSSAELTTLTFPEITHPDDLETDLEYVRRLLSEEIRTYQFQKRYIHKQGHSVWIQLNVSLVRDTKDRPQYFIAQIQDISDRKEMETRMQESEERFRLAFEVAATGMTMFAVDGHFLKANRSLCDILGYTDVELTELTFQDITHPEDLETGTRYIHQLLAKEIRSCQFQKRYIHKQGHSIWVLISISLVRDLQDRPQYFIAQIQDISDRKKAEIELTKSLQDKEVMLQEIHHRVKNNLQVICSLLNLQSRYLKEEKIIRAFTETQNRVKSMALVHQQLYQSDNLSEIVLASYVRQLIGNLSRAYSVTSQIEYHLEIGDFELDLDTAVPCGLIINEIVTNAIKYAFTAKQRGEISIHARANSENNLALTIEDNGVGLKPDYDPETSKSLGLRLVKSLTEQLQGKLDIISSQDSGTKFEFVFNRIKK